MIYTYTHWTCSYISAKTPGSSRYSPITPSYNSASMKHETRRKLITLNNAENAIKARTFVYSKANVKYAKRAYCLPLNSLFDVATAPPFSTQPLTAPCGPNSPRMPHRRAPKNDALFIWKNNPRSSLSS
jgi:hypothetical protein